MAFKNSSEFSHKRSSCTGVLITNLGTPDAPTASSVRTYLAEFLADPRVVEVPRLIWLMILHGIILRIRPRKVAHAYQTIWTEEGSPLFVYTRRQAHLLQEALTQQGYENVKVAWGMRYGNPSISSALMELKANGAERIIVLPLYPQYSASTSASTFDAVSKELQNWRWLPELHFITHYHDHPVYIEAVSNSIRQQWDKSGKPNKLIFSFHGLPQRYLDNGDPYFCECHKSARLVAEHLGLEANQWQVCFQSRFGREPWLQPYTDMTLEDLPQRGVESVDVICPGFSSDCLETLEEINMQNRDIFIKAGGKQFNYIPALNDSDDHIKMMLAILEKHGKNWLEYDVSQDKDRYEHAHKYGANF